MTRIWIIFEVRIDDDAPAGELGTDDGAEDGDDDDDLPDTGAGSLPTMLAGMGLLIVRAAMALRTRRS